mmetsp:Transcript_43605/g.79452  ORF Transcript_43605/g.79452 Transcript_43605/m.79452 type:complete len:887 (+) Transcript_43605:84-2744(+)
MAEMLDGLLDNVQELFGYNRENFFFDAKQRQEREYQEQNMRLKQFELYRQDVRDLVNLTTGKMDSYLAPSAVLLACCIVLLCEGVLEDATDNGDAGDDFEWLIWLYVISLSQAILYLLLSIWLSLHASVAAHSYGVRLLTQFVRLPVPDKAKLDAARTYAAQFEGQGITDMLRVPLWKRQLENMADALGEGDNNDALGVSAWQQGPEVGVSTTATIAASSEDNAGSDTFVGSSKVAVLSLRHVRLYRDLQANWQAHDAYARVCLTLGTYTLVQAFAYYTVTFVSIRLNTALAGIGTAVALAALAWFLTNLDLSIKSCTLLVGAILLMSGPLVTAVALNLWLEGFQQVNRVMRVFIFIQHWVLIICVAYVARGEQLDRTKSLQGNPAGGRVALPTRFRTVLYLDVFGWIDDPGSALVKVDRSEKKVPAPPPGLFESGRDQCWALAADIHRQLLVWEVAQRGANNLLSTRHSWQVSSLRREFNDIASRLPRPTALAVEVNSTRRSKPDVDSDLDNILRSAPEARPVWLYVENLYFQPEPFKAQAELPTEPVISYINTLRDQVDRLRKTQKPLLAMQAAAIRAARPSRRGRGSSSSSAGGSFSAPRANNGNGLQMDETTTSFVSSTTHTTDSTLAQWNSPSSPLLAGNSQPTVRTEASGTQLASGSNEAPNAQTQVTQFGGDEAAQGDGVAAQPFFPRRDGRRESARPPGQVPWMVFSRASGLMVCVWLIGTVWYGFKSFQAFTVHDVGRAKKLSFKNSLALHDDAEVIGLACHEDYGGAVLVADRFKVWELQASDGHSRHTVLDNPSIDRCLAADPTFLSAGLAGVHLHCESAGTCVAVLESSHYGTFLHCPLKARPPSLIGTDSLTRQLQLTTARGQEMSCRVSSLT